jgi:hypothetical protein
MLHGNLIEIRRIMTKPNVLNGSIAEVTNDYLKTLVTSWTEQG